MSHSDGISPEVLRRQCSYTATMRPAGPGPRSTSPPVGEAMGSRSAAPPLDAKYRLGPPPFGCPPHTTTPPRALKNSTDRSGVADMIESAAARGAAITVATQARTTTPSAAKVSRQRVLTKAPDLLPSRSISPASGRSVEVREKAHRAAIGKRRQSASAPRLSSSRTGLGSLSWVSTKGTGLGSKGRRPSTAPTAARRLLDVLLPTTRDSLAVNGGCTGASAGHGVAWRGCSAPP